MQGGQQVSVVENVGVAEAVERAVGHVSRGVVVHILEIRHARTTQSWGIQHRPAVQSSELHQMLIYAGVRRVQDRSDQLLPVAVRSYVVQRPPVEHRVRVRLQSISNIIG